MHVQIPLGIKLPDSATFLNFVAGENLEVVMQLQNNIDSRATKCIYIWGPKSVGKTHLLQAICAKIASLGDTSFYLPLTEINSLSIDIIDGIDKLSMICIDDVDRIVGETQWESTLFHLYNRIFSNDSCLVITGSASPATVGIQLPDLRSRLGGGLVFKLVPLNDDQKLVSMQLRAEEKGMELSHDVARFILQHSPRDMRTLQVLLDRLDRESLAAQRKLTIPFVKLLLKTSSK